MVVTRPDKPVGRKKVLTPSATKTWANEHKILVKTIKELNDLDYDLGIVADFGEIIKEDVFNRAKIGTFNIHFSKLPELRGASPVQYALLEGRNKTSVTIFKLEKTLDTGPILWQKDYPIFPDDTTNTLYTRLFIEVAKELPNIDFSGKLTPQDHQKATFTKMLTKDDGFVKYEDLEKVETYNKYRAMTPWPGLWTIKEGKRMLIRKCHLENEKLVLDIVQFEGKNPVQLS